MPLSICTSFYHNYQQLFYESTLDLQQNKLRLRIFNNTSILKMKRYLNLPKYIKEIFNAGKYIIGLDQLHINLIVIDVMKIINGIIKGNIYKRNNHNHQLNNKRFTKFYYDQKGNLIYGIRNNKQLFYVDIQQSDQIQEQQQNHEYQQINHKLQLNINKIYQSQQQIDKLQIKQVQKYNNRIQQQQQQQRQFFFRINQNNEEEQQNQMNNNNNRNTQQKQVQRHICLLYKHRKQMRILRINWNNDKLISKQTKNNIYDIYYHNNWNIQINYINKQKKQNIHHQQSQSYSIHIIDPYKAKFQLSLRLSPSHIIYSSSQHLFIIDPITGQSCGIFNRILHKFQQCSSIPHNLTQFNSILKVHNVDKYNLRFLFHVFNQVNGIFQYYSYLLPIYKFNDNQVIQEIYLKENILKIFIHNGLIHQDFKQRIKKWVKHNIISKHINNNHNKHNNLNNHNHIRMQRQPQQQSQSQSKIINNQHLLASYFFRHFVVSDKQLVNRLITNLLSKGIKYLFINNKNKNNNFLYWNEHFNSIIKQYTQQIQTVLLLSKNKQKGHNDFYSEQNKFEKTYEQNKQDIMTIVSIYSQILQQIQKYQYLQSINKQKQLIIYQFYTKLIKSNINRSKSIYLIYDLISNYYKKQRKNLSKALKQFQKDLKQIFQNFAIVKQKNMKQYHKLIKGMEKTDYVNINKTSIQQNYIPCLQFHQYFQKSRLLVNKNIIPEFEKIIQYFMLNLNNFQQTAFFYYMIVNKSKQQKQNNMNVNSSMMQSSIQPQLSQSLSKMSKIDIYPFISGQLLQFFKLLNITQEILQKSILQQRKQQVRKQLQQLSHIVLKLENISFVKYICQLVVYYKEQNILLYLINSGAFQLFKQQLLNQQQFNQQQYEIKEKILLIQQTNIFCIKSLLTFNTKKIIYQCLRWIVKQRDLPIYYKKSLQTFINILANKNQIRLLMEIKKKYLNDNKDIEMFNYLLQTKLGSQNYQELIKIYQQR